MTKSLLLTVLLLLALIGKLFAQAPQVSYFSPSSGHVGTTVTISGRNFNPATAANIVYFGGVKATVTTASANSLTVNVPVGATYKPISILNTANNLTGFSIIPFIVTADTKSSITGSDIDPGAKFTTGYLPQSVCMSDIDGDGKLDMVIVNVSSNSVSVFRNVATKGVINSASFQSRVDLPVENSPSNAILQDMDGDGKPELIVTNKQDNTVSVFHNNAVSGTINTGSFGPKTDFVTATSPTALAVGDIDGDGKPDIVVSSGASNTSILLNTSVKGVINASSFAGKFDLAVGFDALVLSDFDSDGKLDIAGVNKGAASVSVLHNAILFSGVLGPTSFEPKVDFFCGSMPVALSVADLNNDSKPDLVTVDRFDNTISVLQNASNGAVINANSFLQKVTFPTGKFPFHVAIDDIDGDGLLDIVVPNYSGNSVSIYHSTLTAGTINTSSFAARLDVPTGQFASAVALGDIDGDGRPDIAVTNDVNTVTLFRNNPTNPPVITAISPLSGPVGTSVTITGTNFNKTPANNIVYFGATRASIVSASATKLVVTVPAGSTYKPISVLNAETQRTAYSKNPFNVTYSGNKGIVSNDFGTISGFIYPTTNFANVQLSDIDGDGKPDMVTGDFNAKNFWVRLNTGTVDQYLTGQFTTPFIFDGGDEIDQLAIADIDGDGKPDILTTNVATHQLSISRNISTPGNVAFEKRINFDIYGLSNRAKIAVGDLNMDGKPDVAITGFYGPVISIFKNTSTSGLISFTTEPDIYVSTGPGLSITDMDGDGKPDLVLIIGDGLSTKGISIIRNISADGGISFSDPVSFSRYANGFSIADMNGDGKPDVVVDLGNGGGYVLPNTSVTGSITTSSLGVPLNLSVGQNITQSESVGDVDGDGKPDIILSNLDQFGLSTFTIYRNNSTASGLAFANGVNVTTATQPGQIAIGDIDGDGLPDFLVAENYNVQPFYYRPQTPFQTNPPHISSFSPLAGPVGSTVTISGDSFNPSVSGNIVAFGDVNAQVISASLTSLTVKVPVGATYKNISVVNTANKLFAYSAAPFNVTFPSKKSITTADFSDPFYMHSSAPNVHGSYTTLNDVDGDGKLDLIVISDVLGYDGKLTVYRNTSAVGVGFNKSSFAAGVDFDNRNYTHATMQDIDGDGKPDLFLTYRDPNSVDAFYIRKNTSTPGNISFDNPILVASSPSSNVGAIADIDGDGLPDIIAGTGFDWKTIAVMRNTYRGKPFTFDIQKSFSAGAGVMSLCTADIDGDGKIDVIVTKEDGAVSVFRNTSEVGNITVSSFASYVDVATGKYVSIAMSADIDGDGKPDIVTANPADSTLSVIRNTSSAGSISFAAKVNFKVDIPLDVTLGDMDGDGKIDIILTTINGPVIFRNNSSPGSFSAASLDPKVGIVTGGDGSTAVGDIDGDGKPDMVSIAKNVISLFRNNPHVPQNPTINAFTPVNAASGTIVTIRGTDFTNASSVTFGGTAATSFTVVSPNIITAVVAGGKSGSVSVTTPLGNASLNGFTFSSGGIAGPVITPLADTVKINLNSNGNKTITLADVATVTNATNASITVSPASFDCSTTGIRTVTVRVSAPGSANNPAAVSFNHPGSVAFDVSGNMYVSDANNYRIRKITPTGQVSTLAGSGSTQDTDGPPSSASFSTSFYSFLTTDPFGNVYLTAANSVRKIDAQGNASTIAGYTNFADGQAYPGPEQAAVFSSPAGIAIRSDGSLYVVNSSGGSISKVTQAGAMTLLAGYYGSGQQDGQGSSASFNYPTGITVDDAGNLYIADTNNNSIRKISPSGVVSTIALSGTPIFIPSGIAVDHAGNIYITELNAVAKITPAGYATILAGNLRTEGGFADGPGATALFNRPNGLCVDRAGNVYVADFNNNRIRKIDPSGLVSTFAGSSQGYVDGNIGVAPASAAALIKTRVSSNLAITNNFADQNLLPIDATARAIIPDYTANVSVTSYCNTAGVKISQLPAAGTFLNAGTTSVITITATDTAGLSVSKTFFVTADGNKTIPVNNFKISTTSVTCKGSNNGAINVKATQNLNYSAAVTGNGLNKNYPFTTDLAIPNLAPGTYNVCITVPGNDNYQQCYSLVITEPQDLSVYSTINDADKNISLVLSGGSQYNIVLNGTTYTTTNNTITLPLVAGNNNISVTTDKLCQGVFQKLMNVSGKFIPYPVPFQSILNLNLGNETVSKVLVEIHDLSNGKLVFSKQFNNQSDVLQLDLSALDNGVFALHLSMDQTDKIFKIVKK